MNIEKTDNICKDSSNEIWKSIEGFPEYQVSNLGRVKSLKRKNEKILAQWVKRQYPDLPLVILYKNLKGYQKGVGRLVFEAFGKQKRGSGYLKHVDGNNWNNNISNLEWIKT